MGKISLDPISGLGFFDSSVTGVAGGEGGGGEAPLFISGNFKAMTKKLRGQTVLQKCLL